MNYARFAEEYLKGRVPKPEDCHIYGRSVHEVRSGLIFMADAGEDDVLVAANLEGFAGEREGNVTVAPLTHENALALRSLVPFTAPSKVLSRDQSCGVGDRLGIAGPGHLRVFEECAVAPVLAQQSMRELSLTNRTYEDVVDAATFSVFRAGFEGGFGADGDHLKNAADIQTALDAGCTMITLDCSEHIRQPRPATAEAARDLPPCECKLLNDCEEIYMNRNFEVGGETIRFTREQLGEASAIYGGAIAFAKEIYDSFFAGGEAGAELEISIDETDDATTPAQHFFIASELRRMGVGFVTLAPRFVGEFQKGIDYIGDLAAFEQDFKTHAAIARHFGYKLSIHSGSDKFSVFPIIQKYVAGKFHLKTAGTSWLEAMRVVASADPGLYREAHALALRSFGEARKYYHVTTDLAKIPPLDTLGDSDLPSLFDQNDARQLIHITYGLILHDPGLKRQLYALWRRERQAYSDALHQHIGKHVQVVTGG